MKKRIGLMWLVPVLFALLLSSAAGARTITTVEGLLELCGTTVNEDITLSGVFDLTGRDWTPIKRVAEGVTIEGNGATIIGMDMSATGDWEGGLDQTGFVGGNEGTISGLKFVLNSSASSRARYNGVVAAVNEYQATITDCTVCGDPNGSEVVLTNTLFNANLGGICGHNVGYVVRCLVSDLTLTDTNGACIGSIAGNNHYYIDSCFADSMKLIGGSVDTKIGGIVGQSIGNVESSFAAHTDFNTVTSTSISGKGLFMGGLVGNARYVDVISNRVNYVDICHEDSEGNSCYLGGILGGLVDLVEGYTSLVSSNYYADNCSAGMSWEDGDYAGGIVGGYQAADSRTVFMRCYYCTDFCSAPMAGINDGYDYPETFDICDGVSKAVMTGEGWAEDNLLSPWKNTGPDNYPVIDDRIPVSFSRVHRGKEYVSLRSARLLWNGKDVSALGLTDADTEFDPADFTLSCADGLSLEIDYVTVN
ncbi:MAG: hypothetical protein J5758_00595, partial [Abditibacteriota bacterium]|nr:hypothetical protein [Abditibacteriota bacterium]